MKDLSTLGDLLCRQSMLHSKGITFIERPNEEIFLSYAALYSSALQVLYSLQSKGIQPRSEILLQVEDNRTFVIMFWACLLGGFIPVPLAVGKNEEHKRKVFNIWPVLQSPHLLIAPADLQQLENFAQQQSLMPVFNNICSLSIDPVQLLTADTAGLPYKAAADDIAFIQFSSGSTGQPKGVMLTHRNLVTNMRAIGKAAAYTPDDSTLSWMPLTHDMGLIGFHLNPLYYGMQQYIMPTGLFVRRPLCWLDKAYEHRATVLCSPNFGYEYLLRHLAANVAQPWDLSYIRIIYNGAEPVSAALCYEFTTQLAAYKLQPAAMCPVYGLAEASVAVTISAPEHTVAVMHLERTALAAGSRVPESTAAASPVAFVNVGKAINDCELRITGNEGQQLPESTIGHIQIRGGNVTTGYYHNPAATAAAITPDGWLRTGDLGFLLQGALYVTGRAKDIFFVNGQNFYPHDIERMAEALPGIELNKIAVAGWFNDQVQRDECIAFVLHRGPLREFVPVIRDLKAYINSNAGLVLDKVIPVKQVPKTTSGKLQRFRLLETYRSGGFKTTELQLNALLSEAEKEKTGHVPPAADNDDRLLELMRGILHQPKLTADDKFFENGGNSLRAAQLVMAVQQVFQVEMPVEALYEKQTARALVAVLTHFPGCTVATLPKAPPMQHYPLLFAQRRLYYAWEMDRGGIAYNMPVIFRLHGTVDADKLEKCIQQLVRRHEALRTFFKAGPNMQVADSVPFRLQCLDCGHQPVDVVLHRLVTPFNLAEAPLFRVNLLNTSGEGTLLFTDFHHIIADGISIYHFMHDLLQLYHNRKLLPLPVQLKDYAVWENNTLTPAVLQPHKMYWQQYLQGPLPVMELPAAQSRPPVFNSQGNRVSGKLTPAITYKLKQLAAAHGSTLHALLFTMYQVLLAKFSGREELVIGIPVAGRHHPDVQQLMGMFVNNLAIRCHLLPTDTFIMAMGRTKELLKNALQHQHYPFDELVRQLAPGYDPGRNPVFDAMFVYHNFGFPAVENAVLSCERFPFDPGTAKFDITLEITEEENSLQYAFEHAAALFSNSLVNNIAAHFERLLQYVAENETTRITDMPWLDDVAYRQYVINYNTTAVSYPAHKTVVQLFEEQVFSTPTAPALTARNEVISYATLQDHMNRVAAVLKEHGIGSGDIVGLLLPRSPALIAGILGILKAGAAYVPIDTELPPERARFLVSNSRCKLVLAANEIPLHVLAGVPDVQVLHINIAAWLPAATPVLAAVPDGLAYVLYTSGTSGDPKGVMITHRSLVNYITWACHEYVKGEKVTFPLFTSIAFDLTVTSIFTPLVSGGTIAIYEENSTGLLIEQVLADNRSDVIKLTPSHLRLVAAPGFPVSLSGSRVRRFIVGGEQLETWLAQRIYELFNGSVEICNEFGPTEATVGCMVHRFSPDEGYNAVPIGIPAANTQIYLLDENLRPVPEGVAGEIFISGHGLAAGYLFNDSLTHEKFISNTFRQNAGMYRTGDLAIWLPGCILSYIGRADQQIKINGHRVEPAEIERRLQAYPGITAAVVCLRKEDAGPYLCAYYTGKDDVRPGALHDYLALHLPHYMIPAYFTQLAAIPLTTNGKTDYRTLPAPPLISDESRDAAPENPVEAMLLEVWKNILGDHVTGVDDNFFRLGGDSIKAVQLTAALKSRNIGISVKDILTYHTIRKISQHAAFIQDANSFEQGAIQGAMALTPIQHWFFSRHFSNPGYYHQSVLLHCKQRPDTALLELAFEILVQHHDGLRLNFDSAGNTMFYNPQHLGNSQVLDIRDVQSEQLPHLFCELKKGFDITADRLFRATLIRLENGKQQLLMVAHHLVVDGISWRILLEDLHHAYCSLKENKPPDLPLKTASLQDWQNALTTYAAGGALKQQAAYWQATAEKAFLLPSDHETSDWSVANKTQLNIILEKDKTQFLLKEAHHAYQTDVLVLLNASLLYMLREWTGAETIVIEQEHHGRTLDTDVSRTVGWFTAMYPVAFEIAANAPIGKTISAVKESIRRVPDHGIGYGVHRYLLQQTGLSDRQPCAVRCNYLGRFDTEFDNTLFAYSNQFTGPDADPADHMTAMLELNAMVVQEQLHITFSYNSKAHDTATIRRLTNSFVAWLDKILVHIKEVEDVHLTPSDFDSVDLDEQELNELFN